MEKVCIFTEIEESFSRISSNCLSLLQQLNNNIVERCNSVLAKIIIGKRINYGLKSSYECRPYASVTQSNTENTLSQVAAALNKTPNDIVCKIENSRKKKNCANKIRYHLKKMHRDDFDKKKSIRTNKDEFYGKYCSKPDLDESEYKAKAQRIMLKLIDQQNRRDEIEMNTREQSDNYNWIEIRKSLLTASNFKSICCRRTTTLSANLIQSQLHITNRKYCDLFIWTPVGTKPFYIERNDTFWEQKMEPFLKLFYEECLLPEIVDSRTKRKMPLREPSFIIEAKIKKEEDPKSKMLKKRKLNAEIDDDIINKKATSRERRKKSLDLLSLYGFASETLWSDEFFTLKKDEWINGSDIDSFIIVNFHKIWKANNVISIPTAITNFIVGDRCFIEKDKSWHMYNLKYHFPQLVFSPYCRSSHWCLIVLDIKKKTFMHINPIEKSTDGVMKESTEVYNLFIKYLNECNVTNDLCAIEWQQVIFTEKRPMQKDSVNCGVYVMYYMHCLGNNIRMTLDFDPNEYRKIITQDLLSSSDSMENNCLA
ncbi:hypothetical protein TSAR_011407 [Trichomalopsis sarcophagae]|uniref:Ubiquitin-like protease family profile domain-containing protein n=1 Tax=Trichomalopsis sarcophagae TaxID=543379 RepID=A0A232EHI1_9HYME|nr:hypothetical protein TSAR_011407 [Trichomalopsis sarcophagae]